MNSYLFQELKIHVYANGLEKESFFPAFLNGLKLSLGTEGCARQVRRLEGAWTVVVLELIVPPLYIQESYFDLK